jgi:hypothetical protein
VTASKHCDGAPGGGGEELDDALKQVGLGIIIRSFVKDLSSMPWKIDQSGASSQARE